MGARVIAAALDDLGGLTPAPQPDTGVTYAAKIDKAETRIDWSGDADGIVRLINGVSPHPGAWADFGGERVKVLRAKPANNDLPAGRIASDDGLYIGAGDGTVEILELQRAGRRPAPVSEVLRGWQPPDTVSP